MNPVRTRTPLLAGLALATGLVALAGIGLLRHFDLDAIGSLLPGCAFRALTGWYCPGCGVTRMLYALAHFDIPRAFSMNPLALLILALSPLLAAWTVGGWQPAALQPLAQLLARPAFWLVLLPAYWLGRNLPWFPFTLLAPG